MERAERSRKMEEERQQKIREEQERNKQMEIERKRKEQIAREKILEKAEEKRQQLEKMAKEQKKREEIQKKQEEEEARKQRRLEEEAKAAQRREQDELRRVKQQEVAPSASGRSPQVARRTDDVHGLGFGQVRTGSVMSRKISLLTRAGSLEPELSETESPAPRRRTVRFAGLDSPSPTLQAARRPKVHTGGVAAEVQRWTESTGWTHMVAQMDRDAAIHSPASRRAVSESPHPTLSPSPHPTLS